MVIILKEYDLLILLFQEQYIIKIQIYIMELVIMKLKKEKEQRNIKKKNLWKWIYK